jgi:hypothetical protein
MADPRPRATVARRRRNAGEACNIDLARAQAPRAIGAHDPQMKVPGDRCEVQGPCLRRRLLLAGAVALLFACATEPPSKGRGDLLDFIVDGKTPASDVYLRLGMPARTFEGGRIATWRLARDAAGLYLVAAQGGWLGVRYEFVVEFSEARLVQRHSLVEVHAP